MSKLEDFLVVPSATIHHCLKLIEKNKHRTLIVVDDSLNLIGTVTDGDIRKAIINRIPIDSQILDFINKNCVFIDSDEKISVSSLMKRYPEIGVFPVLKNNIVVDIITVYLCVFYF
jgi:CBS domain-containing protein